MVDAVNTSQGIISTQVERVHNDRPTATKAPLPAPPAPPPPPAPEAGRGTAVDVST